MPEKLSDLGRFVRMVARRFNDDRCMQIASSLTYTTLLSLVPLVTVALTLISAFPVFSAWSEQLQSFLFENLLPESAHVVAKYGEQFTANAAQLTAVGIAFLAITAILLLLTIEYAFNQIWRVQRARSVVQRIFIYWALITIGPVLFGASLSLTSWLVSLSLGLVEGIPGVGVGLLGMVPVALMWVVFALLYLAMPNRRVLVRDALVGALIAALAFEAMKRGFAIYIAQVPTYRLVYGAFAAVPIFLLWIYLSWLVVLSGAIIVAVLPEWRQQSWQGESAPGTQFFDALHILRLLWEAHHEGTVYTPRQLHAAVKLRVDQLEEMLDTMSAAQWIGRTGAGWALIRDPRDIRVVDVYQLFVFRGGPRITGRETTREIDAYAQKLGGKIEAHMQMSIEEFFQRSGSARNPDATKAAEAEGGEYADEAPLDAPEEESIEAPSPQSLRS